MIKTGLTSITFRNLTVDEIINLTVKTNLSVIEWGSDIHCQYEDLEALKNAKKLCSDNNIKINSYGTYYKLSQNENYRDVFKKIINATKILDTNIIRIWAGVNGSANTSNYEFLKMVEESQFICDMAQNENIIVAFEYHPNTLTDSKESALKLITTINKENCKLYWQPNFDIGFEENIAAIKLLYDYIIAVHCFSWDKGCVRLPLSQKINEWKDYYKLLKDKDISILLEFIKEDDVLNFISDAKALNDLIINYK